MVSAKKALVYAAVILVGLCLATYIHGIRRVDPERLKRLITQALPAGTDESSLIVFLDSNHIRHSEYSPQLEKIFAGVPKSYIGIVNGHIHIEFKFNENGKLTEYDLRELFEMPF